MKKTLLAYAVIALVLFNYSCTHKDSKSLKSAVYATKEVPVTEFMAISSALPVSIVYEQKDAPAYFKMNIDQSLLDKVDIQVKDSVLYLNLKSGTSLNINTDSSVIYTNSKTLKMVSVTGAGNFTIKGPMKSKMLDMRIEGAGNFEADELNCTSFALTVSGAGNATVKGSSEAAAYNLDGVGNVNANDFAVKRLRVFVNGAGSANINASDYLYAVIKGVGNIKYKQKPKTVESNIEGVGKIEQE